VFRLAYLWQVPGLKKRGLDSVADVDVRAELAALGVDERLERAFDRALSRGPSPW
jgi:hypothetical protein